MPHSFPTRRSSDLGDEAEAAQPRALAGQQVGGAVPPVHDEVGGLVHMRMRLPQRLGIAGLHPPAQILAADEGRVADDEFRLRPARQALVTVGVDLDLFAAGIRWGGGAAGLVATEGLAVVGVSTVRGGETAIDVAEP